MLRFAFFLLLFSCGFTRPLARGLGSVSDSSYDRLHKDERVATSNRTRTACVVAGENNQLRLFLKCAELTANEISSQSLREIPPYANAVLAKLESHDDRCAAWPAVGKVYRAMSDRENEKIIETRTAKTCRSIEAATAAAYVMRSLNECSAAVQLAQEAFGWAKDDHEQVVMLDAIAMCSDAYTLEKNLAFTSLDVRERYRNLLRVRRAKAIEAERRYVAERIEQQAEEARSRCSSDCWSAGANCRNACRGSSSCYSACAAFESACNSRCH